MTTSNKLGDKLYAFTWLCSALAVIALATALISFPIAFRAISLLENELEIETQQVKAHTDVMWQELLQESSGVHRSAKREIQPIKRHNKREALEESNKKHQECFGGGLPLSDVRGDLVRCSVTPCPIGYRCTLAEIPWFQVCCPVSTGLPVGRARLEPSFLIEPEIDSKEIAGLPPQCNCDEKNTCPPGPPGDKGIVGTPGEPGTPGEDGSDGLEGLDYLLQDKTACPPCPPGRPGELGPAGAPGGPGTKGPPGPPGPNAPPGSQGGVGEPGSPGPSGPPGKSGDPGRQGTDAVRNLPGPAGPPGPSGDPGSAGGLGTPGSNGEPGQLGNPGPPGNAGEPGEPGAPGSKGIPGEEGESGNDAQYCACPERNRLYNNLLARKIIRISANKN